MPATKLVDIIEPDVWVPYMIERTRTLSALWGSGIVVENEKYDQLAGSGGSTVNLPFFQDLTGESEVLSDSAGLSVNKIAAVKDVAHVHYRGKAWGTNDLAPALSGADVAGAIADLVGTWWARDFQKVLLANLKGIFATTLGSTHVYDASIAAGNSAVAANLVSSDNVISAFDKLGDASGDLTAIAMHSTVYHRLLRQEVIQFDQPSAQGAPIRSYLGRRVIVDDALPRVAGGTNGFVYTTFLFGAGSVAFGEGMPEMPVEMDRDSLAGESYLINRRHYLLHPQGIKYVGTPAGISPTNTELELGTAWTRVYEQKNVRIVALKTNG